MPEFIEPMLAGTGEFPGGPDWAVEFAWEGLRVIAYATPQRVRLLSSTSRTITTSFPDLEDSLRRAAPRAGVVLDGTVVALNANRLPRRRALQSRSGTSRPSDALVRRVPAGFLAGDVLWCDGRSTLDLPYRARRALRDELAFDEERAWPTPSFPAEELGAVMATADQHGLDAIYAKHLESPYRPGRRSKHLLRLPVRRVRQVVVGGFSPADPRRPDSAIGALLLGVPDEAGLRYVGRAGLRTADDRSAVAAALPGLRRARSPFDDPLPPEIAEHAVWMAPRLVGRVEFAEWTADGRLRLPTWRGLVSGKNVDPAALAHPPARPNLAPGDPPAAEPPVPPPDEPAAPPGLRLEQRRLEQHFVYNALNTIASVIRTDPDRARDLLLDFADLNRAADRNAATTTLGEEMEIVRAYLGLEQARFGSRLGVEIEVDPGVLGSAVEPLALLDAVRTTVQEHIEPRPEGGTLAVMVRAGVCAVGITGEPPRVTVPLGSR